jgi:chemotaxis protein MotB
MKSIKIIGIMLVSSSLLSSCVVSKKKFTALQQEMDEYKAKSTESLNKCQADLFTTQQSVSKLNNDLVLANSSIINKTNQIETLKDQLEDCRSVRDKQLSQVGNLTVLTQQANDNIKETLAQLERKDKYIHLLQAAKSKADSINLALAVNLKGVLKDGLDDKDIDIKVDKTVVFINLSDKMLFKSGSFELTSKADDVLKKIAQIIESRPDLEVMIEGYTDNVPMKNNCISDNWDLSVKRSTSVVRTLQNKYGINPNRLIASGRGEYNQLVPNDSPDNRAINRRTRIIILPKLNEFYDLLNPNNIPQ